MIKIIFEISCKLYSFIFTKYENFFYKRNIKKNELEELGYVKLNQVLSNSIDINDFQYLSVNKYLKKLIFNKKKIYKIINEIFIKNDLKNYLTNITGLNYSIDYFTAYETFPIDEIDRSKGWYANKLHRDKPFSNNTIKLIIPLIDIDEDNGPMKIADIESSKKISLGSYLNENFYNFSGKNRDIFVFKPNVCFHVAGIPLEGKTRKQIMMQLNPSKAWKYNKKIDEFQKIREPKFPFFSYFFEKKELL